MSHVAEKELTEFEKNLVESIYENIGTQKLRALGKLFTEMATECEEEFVHLFEEGNYDGDE